MSHLLIADTMEVDDILLLRENPEDLAALCQLFEGAILNSAKFCAIYRIYNTAYSGGDFIPKFL